MHMRHRARQPLAVCHGTHCLGKPRVGEWEIARVPGLRRIDPCEHPAMFADHNAPAYIDGAFEGGPAYSAWLDHTRRCRHCGEQVANRDL